MSKVIGVAEVKEHLSEVIEEVSHGVEQFIIARKGRPMAAIVSLKDLESLESIEKGEKPAEKKGLLAAVGAWDDFEGIEEVIEHIYEKRRRPINRKVNGLS